MYYIAHRLFALHDRALGALVASELATRVGADQVFLPFCDTDEENLVAECKGRRLFELDVQRLERLDGMIALLHGPSLDDGVCLEIGYACERDVPVVVLTTDFQTYGLSPAGAELQFPDPLAETLATDVIRVSRLAPAAGTGPDRFETFRRRNVEPLRAAAACAVESLLSYVSAVDQVATTPPVGPRTVFVEPSPYGNTEQTQAIVRSLRDEGLVIFQAGRLQARQASYATLLQRAGLDWQQLQSSEILIVDINGPETPPGAALLVGASVAAGRRVLAAYEDNSYTFAHGREPNFRNLMVQYSLASRFRTVAELRKLLSR